MENETIEVEITDPVFIDPENGRINKGTDPASVLKIKKKIINGVSIEEREHLGKLIQREK